jgi:hypothetical protein
MKSENFEILRDRWPELAAIGGFAEAYAHPDPSSALVKLRLFAENLTKDTLRESRQVDPCVMRTARQSGMRFPVPVSLSFRIFCTVRESTTFGIHP